MRRAVLTLSGTVAGLAALFSFRTHVPGVSEVATPSTPTGLSASAPEVSTSGTASPTLKPPTSAPSKSAASSATSATGAKASKAPTMTRTTTAPSASAPAITPSSAAASSTPTKKASSPATTAPAAAPSTSAAAPSGSFAGPTEDTQYGEVQVTITVSDGKITNADGNLPDGGDSIGANAVSQLDSEVVADQSASVQAVSGATYTSDGYIASLQSAVDQAGL